MCVVERERWAGRCVRTAAQRDSSCRAQYAGAGEGCMTSIAPLQSLRILVAEDEYWLAMDLADDLRAMGADVLAVKGSLAEVRAAADHATRIDVAVLDINLRGEMIYPLVDELIVRQVPVVFATGYSWEAIPARYAS